MRTRTPEAADGGRATLQSADEILPGTVLCGYRVVRLLGRDADARSYLAHRVPPSGQKDSPDAAGRLRTEPVLIRVFHTAGSADLVSTALRVSEQVESPFIQRLVDVGTHRHRIVVAWEQTHISLAALLRARGSLPQGEAVTVLAPLAQAIDALHLAGYSCRSLTTAYVHLTSEGRPVLAELERVVVPAGDSDRGRLQREDYRAFARICREVLGSGPSAADAADGIERAVESDTDDLSSAIEYRLFSLAEPLPVDLNGGQIHAERVSGSSRARAGTGQLSTRRDAEGLRPRRQAERTRGIRRAALTAIDRLSWLIPGSLLSVVESIVGRRSESRSEPSSPRDDDPRRADRRTAGRAPDSGADEATVRRGPRPRVIGLACAVAVVAVTVGLVAIPEADETRSASTSSETFDRTSTGTADAGASTAEGTEEHGSPPEAAASGDDPVVAARYLLAARDDCLVAADRACLDDVDEESSAIHVADAHSIAVRAAPVEAASGAEITLELVQRLGDTAIVRTTETRAEGETAERQPAIVLLVRTTAGWRLRDLFESDGV
ncbi:hypothetical protein GCM10027416_16300 [Okibacterium endophyticum]